MHSRELCSALLGTSVDGAGRGEEEEEETKSGYPERGGRVSPVRAPSRGSTAMHIEDWLSRKARRAVVVSATVCIPYMDILLMVYCMQALPDDADLTAIKGVCQAILEEEHRFLSVSTSSLALVCCAYHRPSPASSSSLTHTHRSLRGFCALKRPRTSVRERCCIASGVSVCLLPYNKDLSPRWRAQAAESWMPNGGNSSTSISATEIGR